MCVIMVVEETRPSEIMIDQAWNDNSHGAGIAWREGEGDASEVVWSKGLSLDDVKIICETAPLPFVVHFRTASVGGVRRDLTHPFEISKSPSLKLEGRTKNHVLFHNGHWNEWDKTALEAAVRNNLSVPTGKWSDSRVMAWLCSVYGLGFMELLPKQKGVAFGPGTDDLEIFTGDGWNEVTVEGGGKIWCSNDYFRFRKTGHGACGYIRPVCRYGQCTSRDTDLHGYCPLHTDGKRVTELTAGSGGAQPNNAPFRLVPGQLITLEFAEKLQKAGRINSQLLKGIRRAINKMQAGGQKAAKAKSFLEGLTASQLGLRREIGSVH